MLLSASAFAQNEVTIDFDNDYKTLFPTITGESSGSGSEYVADGEFNETTTSAAVDGCTVTVTASDAEASNRNRIWASSPRLRMFDGTITITAPKKFKKLTMNVKTNKSNVAAGNTVNVGSLDVTGLNGTNNGVIVWTGNASEVVMTIAGNTQFKNIVISYDGGDTPQPQVIEATVSEALDVIAALGNAATTTDQYKVTGYVVGAPDFQRNAQEELYGNVNLDIADAPGGTALLTVFRAYKAAGNVKFEESDLNMIKEGDKVVFQGYLKKYVKDEVVTPELVNGYLVSVISGIQNITIDEENAPAYSLDGRRVDQNYRGVVIKGGKKMIQK